MYMGMGESQASSQTSSKSLVQRARDNSCVLDMAFGEINHDKGDPACGEGIHCSEDLGK